LKNHRKNDTASPIALLWGALVDESDVEIDIAEAPALRRVAGDVIGKGRRLVCGPRRLMS
jgi:hypothetical protein